MLTSLLKPLAALLLVSLLVAFHAPLAAAASDDGMDCCQGGMTAMCCPLPGSCSMRSCGADEGDALLSTVSAFLLPTAAAAPRPAASRLAPTIEASSSVSQASPVLDPPPRG